LVKYIDTRVNIRDIQIQLWEETSVSGTIGVGAASSALALAILLAAGAARAAETVYATDSGRDCYVAAKFGDPQRHGIADCTTAIIAGVSNHDRAGFLVNRGVVYLGYERYNLAIDDFNAAIKLDPNIGEAYTNRGAAEVAKRRFAEGKADIDHGLALGSEEPQKAYFNRGLANEHLGDDKAAYFDYLKASELDPQWTAPKTELSRFTVAGGEAGGH
jgi:tetratricopeptide (TPR) repeat protein